MTASGGLQIISRYAGLFSLALLAVAACSEEQAPASADVQVVAASLDLQLGSAVGDGPESFGRIGGLLGDPQGRILVADYQAHEIRVFDSLGAYQFRFGREGSGPGEFRGPCCLALGPEGRVWVRDGGNHRYSAFDLGESGADPVSTVEMSHSDANFMAPPTFSESGRLIDVGHRTSRSGDLSLVRFELSADGRVSDSTVVPGPDPSEIGEFTLTRETDAGQIRLYFYQPFAPRHIVAHGPRGRWATGVGSDYSLRLHGAAGILTIRGDAEAHPLSAEERERAQRRLEADAARAGRRPGQLPYEVPDLKPSLRAAFFDSVGRLWVERNTPDGSPRVADLWTDDGRLAKRVQWPEDITLEPPAWLGEDWGLGIRRDSLDVQYVVRIRF